MRARSISSEEMLMGTKPRAVVTGDIIRELRRRGLSRRSAVRIFNAILGEMKVRIETRRRGRMGVRLTEKGSSSPQAKVGLVPKQDQEDLQNQFTVVLVNEQEIEDRENVEKRSRDERRQLLK